MSDPVVIVSAARTPIGGLLGDFANLSAAELGAVAIKAAVERAGVPSDAINEVLMGNCRQLPISTSLMASLGTPARSTAALMATAPNSAALRLAKSPSRPPMGVRAADTMTTGSLI